MGGRDSPTGTFYESREPATELFLTFVLGGMAAAEGSDPVAEHCLLAYLNYTPPPRLEAGDCAWKRTRLTSGFFLPIIKLRSASAV